MTIAETNQGPIQGRVKDDVFLFAGVPYAMPPVGQRRFQAAVPHESWEEVRAATRFSPAAPQLVTGGMTSSVPVNWNEDCLYLNVSTPSIDDKKRPVLFWIHGGGYRTGQGAIPWYAGSRFNLNGDIVVVSINYRMGALGFTDLSRFGKEYATSGINGTLDQITALEWVRDNIENFGGDPNQVTIAGESAGAFSVATLLGSPAAQGLFHRAIAQSGAAHHCLTKEAGEKVTDIFLKEMDTDDPKPLLNASVDDILKVQQRIDTELQKGVIGSSVGGFVSPFYPVEGNRILPQSPLEAINNGMGKDVDLLLGTNKDESTLFIMNEITEDKLCYEAERYGGGQKLLDQYRKAYPEANSTEMSIQLSTDHVFRVPALRLAEARSANQANTWMYLFAWESRNQKLKSTHSLEIPFAFNNLDKPGVDAFIGEGPLPQDLANTMHNAWINFVREGNPGWAQYDLDERINMRFDTLSQVVDDPDSAVHSAWKGIR